MKVFELPRWLWSSGHIIPRFARFGSVGVLSSTVYAIVTALMITQLHVRPVPASICGYCISAPVSFFGHRGFSFRSQGLWGAEMVRFALAQALNIAVTASAMEVAIRMHLSWIFGMVGAVALVPLANFLAMNFWVFRDGLDGAQR